MGQNCATLEYLPASLHSAAHRIFGAYCNNFNGTLQLFDHLEKLEQVDVHYNEFHGTLPSLSKSKDTLTYFSAAVNQLTGTIPQAWMQLSKLDTAGLAYNRLHGTIDWLFTNEHFPGLKVLYIRNNNFSGAFPAALPGGLQVLDAGTELCNYSLASDSFVPNKQSQMRLPQ